jgi:hypothetical protein
MQFENIQELPINNSLRDDMLYQVSRSDPWYADIVNFIVLGYIPLGEDKRKFIYESRRHMWDDLYLFRVCSNGLLRRCVPLRKELRSLKDVTHHHMEDVMAHSAPTQKSSRVDFFWPTTYEDTKDFVRRCGACQRHGNINARDAMPLTTNLQIELFNV